MCSIASKQKWIQEETYSFRSWLLFEFPLSTSGIVTFCWAGTHHQRKINAYICSLCILQYKGYYSKERKTWIIWIIATVTIILWCIRSLSLVPETHQSPSLYPGSCLHQWQQRQSIQHGDMEVMMWWMATGRWTWNTYLLIEWQFRFNALAVGFNNFHCTPPEESPSIQLSANGTRNTWGDGGLTSIADSLLSGGVSNSHAQSILHLGLNRSQKVVSSPVLYQYCLGNYTIASYICSSLYNHTVSLCKFSIHDDINSFEWGKWSGLTLPFIGAFKKRNGNFLLMGNVYQDLLARWQLPTILWEKDQCVALISVFHTIFLSLE